MYIHGYFFLILTASPVFLFPGHRVVISVLLSWAYTGVCVAVVFVWNGIYRCILRMLNIQGRFCVVKDIMENWREKELKKVKLLWVYYPTLMIIDLLNNDFNIVLHKIHVKYVFVSWIIQFPYPNNWSVLLLNGMN